MRTISALPGLLELKVLEAMPGYVTQLGRQARIGHSSAFKAIKRLLRRRLAEPSHVGAARVGLRLTSHRPCVIYKPTALGECALQLWRELSP